MIEIKDKSLCSGCGGCANVCPVNAIEMKEDKEGFLYPVVIKEKCIRCGLCEKICPIKNREFFNDPEFNVRIFASWNKDEKIRLDSTSGGVFTEIAKYVLDQGGYVCGAVYNQKFMVEHFITNDKTKLNELRSSKYLQSDIGNVFREIKKLLDDNNVVLMCGAPCQIAGLYRFLRKKYDNLITCDFICRGVNSPKIFQGYIKDLEQKYHSKVKSVKFKNKTFGWHNFSTKIEFENNKKYLRGRYLDSYMVGYLQYNAFVRPACYDCKFKGFPRIADITLADFWGIKSIDSSLDNNKGTSMVMVNNKKGEEILSSLNELFLYEVESTKTFRDNLCVSKSIDVTEARKNVFDNIDNMTYAELSECFFPVPKSFQKLKVKVKYSRPYEAFKNVVKKIIRK